MKVLLISHTCQSRSEGQPKAIELAHLGITLKVIVPRRWMHYGQWRSVDMPPKETKTPFVLSAMTVRCPWFGPAQSYLHWYPGLSRVLSEWQPDVIDLWEEPWSLVSAHTCWLRERICPTAALVSETEQNIDKTLPPPFEAFRTYVLKKADFVVGRNTEAIEIIKRKGFQGSARVVPNAVDAQLFRPAAPPERQLMRSNLGWKESFVCGYVGRLVEEKGLEDFVEAIGRCPSHIMGVLIGDGPFEPNLREQIARLNLQSRVHFFPSQGREELASMMNALDVLVLPSRTTSRWKEQFGRVLIEAQACGVPVVGSSSGAIPDVVADAGIIFAEGDVAQLSAALVRLDSDAVLCHELGERGKARVAQHYTWTRVAENMTDVYRMTLASKRGEFPR